MMSGVIFSYFTVFIALFLSGMLILKTGLYQFSGESLQSILLKLTRTPLHGLFVGMIVTALLQSSSAVMVMMIGLIAAGHLSFKHSIGIILGTNIGTTFTAEIITFDLDQFIVPFLLFGLIFMLQNKQFLFSLGTVFFGLGCIFTAMNGFESLASSISSISIVSSLIQFSEQYQVIGVGFGTIVTAIIQSSTATTGIVMSFVNQEILSLPSAISIVLGANLGTCITAMMASIGSNRESKLAAYTHVWVNVFTVLFFFPFISLMSKWILAVTLVPDVQIAHLSLLMNVVVSLLLLPFASSLSRLILFIHDRQ